MPTRQILVLGYYGFGNAGDELLLKALVNEILTLNPNTKIVCVSANPTYTQSIHSLPAVARQSLYKILSHLWKSDSFYLGGGGLIQDQTSFWSTLYYMGWVTIAKGMGCRTHLRGIGVDPLSSRLNRVIVSFILNCFVNELSVRDENSRTLLKSFGVRRDIHVEPDLVWQYAKQLREMKQSPTHPKRVAWCISSSGFNQDLKVLADKIDQEAVQEKTETDLLIFFPAQDQSIAERLVKLCQTPVKLKSWQTLEELISWIPTYSRVISSRFHALVLADAMGVPYSGFGPHPKVKSLCENSRQPYRERLV